MRILGLSQLLRLLLHFQAKIMKANKINETTRLSRFLIDTPLYGHITHHSIAQHTLHSLCVFIHTHRPSLLSKFPFQTLTTIHSKVLLRMDKYHIISYDSHFSFYFFLKREYNTYLTCVKASMITGTCKIFLSSNPSINCM